MSPRAWWMLLAFPLAVASSGCDKKKADPVVAAGSSAAPAPAPAARAKAPPAQSAEQGAPFQKPILEGLKKAGLGVGEFETTAARPYQARACARGEVSKLDVMACQYDGEQTAEQARPSLEQFAAGAGTGAVRRSGTLVLAVADRTKIDPRGKLVDKMLKTFSSLGLR